MYLDTIGIILKYVARKYPEPSTKVYRDKKIFKKKCYQYRAVEEAMKRCMDNPDTDPIFIIENVDLEYCYYMSLSNSVKVREVFESGHLALQSLLWGLNYLR